jgi:methyl-accepting chemotaxis protein
LRLRLWIGCLAGVLVAAAGLAWILAADIIASTGAEPRLLLIRIAVVMGVALLASLGFALWLDRGIVGRLRNLARGAALGQLVEPKDVGAEPGWGELGDLTRTLQSLLTRNRQLNWASVELEASLRQITAVREAIEHWNATERWEGLPGVEGPLKPFVDALNRGFGRQTDVFEQNHEAARQVSTELASSLGSAREAAEQAEQGFVESTALLTTVRELQRLSAELQQAIDSAALSHSGAENQAYQQWRSTAAEAIEELIAAAGGSIEHLAAGLSRVQEIAEHVHLLSNRATLIALNVVVAGGRPGHPEAAPEALSGELKELAREVRAATDRVGELSRDVEREARAATERMRGIRDRVAVRLDQAPVLPATESQRSSDDINRLLERVREMVQDATTKGERLSAAGERASRAAQNLVRELEDEARDVEGLVIRLSPAGTAVAPDEPIAPEQSPRPTSLRVVERQEPRQAEPRRGREERS